MAVKKMNDASTAELLRLLLSVGELREVEAVQQLLRPTGASSDETSHFLQGQLEREVDVSLTSLAKGQ